MRRSGGGRGDGTGGRFVRRVLGGERVHQANIKIIVSRTLETMTAMDSLTVATVQKS